MFRIATLGAITNIFKSDIRSFFKMRFEPEYFLRIEVFIILLSHAYLSKLLSRWFRTNSRRHFRFTTYRQWEIYHSTRK